MLFNLCNVNPDIQHTSLYTDKRDTIIKSLKRNMRNGRLLVNGDYCIVVSNPIEMLKNACGMEWTNTLHKPYEIYTTLYDDGEEVTGFRNPHVASGNVCILTNRRVKEIDIYMNLTKNICVINSYKNDIQSRLQGMDMDSDCILLVKSDIILKAAKECIKFPTPLNRIKAINDDKPRLYNKADIAEVDSIIGENLIGQTINLSQLFNSYYWDYKAKGATEEQLQIIYDCVSVLSSISQLEIDKAKKFFTLNVKNELTKIAKTVFNQKQLDELEYELRELRNEKNKYLSKINNRHDYEAILASQEEAISSKQGEINEFLAINEKIIKKSDVELSRMLLQESDLEKIGELDNELEIGLIDEGEYKNQMAKLLKYKKPKQIKPKFFKHNSQDKNCEFVDFVTPMDFLSDIIDTKINRAKRDTNKLELEDLLISADTSVAMRRQVNKLQDIAIDTKKRLKQCYTSHANADDFNYNDYRREKESIINEAVLQMKRVKISKIETMLLLLLRCFSNRRKVKVVKLSNCRTILTSLLYKSHTRLFIECFKKA